MKILHIVNFYPERGGPYTANKELLSKLWQKGVYVKVLSTLPPNYGNKSKDYLKALPFEVIYIKELLPHSIYRSFSLRFIYKIPQLAKEFDIIHLAMIFDFYSLPLLFVNKKLVITLCGEFMPQAYKSRLLSLIKKDLYMHTIGNLLLNKASAIHALSEREKSSFIEYFPKFKDKITVIPNGLDFTQLRVIKDLSTVSSTNNNLHNLSAFTSNRTLNIETINSLPQNAIKILFLGRIAKIKGLDLLIPAFAKLSKEKSNAYLIIAGKDDGDGYEKVVRDLVKSHQIEDRVKFIGFVQDKEKYFLLKQCDLFVMPSYSENFGIAIVEAIASGLPTITTNQVGIADDIIKHNLGFITNPSIECIYCTIKRVLEIDKAELVKLVTSAQEKVFEKYDIENVANKFIEMYKSI